MIARRISVPVLLMLVCFLITSSSLMAAEVRIYKETVKVPASGDEYTALQAAKQKAKEQALAHFIKDMYPGQSEKLNLGGDDQYIDDVKVLETSVGGLFSKEMTAVINVVINENAVTGFLKRQGTATGKNDDRRIFVILIPGKSDSGDAPGILDKIRTEVRKKLTAAEFTVIDDPEHTRKMESLTSRDLDYDKLATQLEGMGEWLILAKVDTKIIKGQHDKTFHTLITGKAVAISSRDLLWEGNIDGEARGGLEADALIGLTKSAINGGVRFADDVLHRLQSKSVIGEKRGVRYEVVMKLGGKYALERKVLKILKEDIQGLKSVNQKQRGKGDLVFDVFYAGKISDLVDLLLDQFENDPFLKRLNPQIDGNKVVFR
jgi:hypothetical protein